LRNAPARPSRGAMEWCASTPECTLNSWTETQRWRRCVV
jgi:hypothetical protein